MYRSITLPNGAKLLTEFIPGARTAALGFFVGTGSRHERAAESGAAHFIEHMSFKGTRRRDSGALARETDEITEHLSKDDFQANVCLNYGGRDEILRAVRQFAAECAEGKRKPEDLDETLFSTYLDSAGIPDPELIIRPRGEQRLSNFLLWQCAYSEFYYTDALWPDFDEEELDKAIAAYQSRDRRFGGVKK